VRIGGQAALPRSLLVAAFHYWESKLFAKHTKNSLMLQKLMTSLGMTETAGNSESGKIEITDPAAPILSISRGVNLMQGIEEKSGNVGVELRDLGYKFF